MSITNLHTRTPRSPRRWPGSASGSPSCSYRSPRAPHGARRTAAVGPPTVPAAGDDRPALSRRHGASADAGHSLLSVTNPDRWFPRTSSSGCTNRSSGSAATVLPEPTAIADWASRSSARSPPPTTPPLRPDRDLTAGSRWRSASSDWTASCRRSSRSSDRPTITAAQVRSTAVTDQSSPTPAVRGAFEPYNDPTAPRPTAGAGLWSVWAARGGPHPPTMAPAAPLKRAHVQAVTHDGAGCVRDDAPATSRSKAASSPRQPRPEAPARATRLRHSSRPPFQPGAGPAACRGVCRALASLPWQDGQRSELQTSTGSRSRSGCTTR
jgi:hypothetical protein